MPVVCRLVFRNPVTNLRSDMNGLDLYTVNHSVCRLSLITSVHLELSYRQRSLCTLSTIERRYYKTSKLVLRSNSCVSQGSFSFVFFVSLNNIIRPNRLLLVLLLIIINQLK